MRGRVHGRVDIGEDGVNMKQKLYTAIRTLYASKRGFPNVCVLKVEMKDKVDGEMLNRAAEQTMKRYPYFCVELKKEDGADYFVDNPRPVRVVHGREGVPLNSEESGFHFLEFYWYDNDICLEFSHALTDGAGAYELMRTLLYCYCREYYGEDISPEGIRTLRDEIPLQEWEDAAAGFGTEPPAGHTDGGGAIRDALNLKEALGDRDDDRKTLYGLSIDEEEFMRFNRSNDGSPGVMTALLLSRAIARVYPKAADPIRISLCVNMRKALGIPLAHQSIIGGAWLEYKDKMRLWPIGKQSAAYRGMVLAQTREEVLVDAQISMNRQSEEMIALSSDEERALYASDGSDSLKKALTATVSYVGKSDFGEMEKHISSIHGYAYAMNESLLIEVSAVSKRIFIEFIQNFSSSVYAEAFQKELEENGIRYAAEPAKDFRLAPICHEWLEGGD